MTAIYRNIVPLIELSCSTRRPPFAFRGSTGGSTRPRYAIAQLHHATKPEQHSPIDPVLATAKAEEHRGRFFPEFNEAMRTSVAWGIVAAAAAAGLALAYYTSPRSRYSKVPDDVAALCAEAARLRNTGAPLSAANKYSAAYARCKACGAPPAVTLEILIHLADAQLDGRQAARAQSNYEIALALAVRLRSTLAPAEAAVLDLPRKHAAILTRLSDLAAESDQFGGAAVAVQRGVEALHVLDGEYADLATAALAGAFACDSSGGDDGGSGSGGRRGASGPRLACRLQRHVLADYAGVHFNLSRLLAVSEGAGAGSSHAGRDAGAPAGLGEQPPPPAVAVHAAAGAGPSEAALQHAFRAAVLVASARHSCCQELKSAVPIASPAGNGVTARLSSTLAEVLSRVAPKPRAPADPAPHHPGPRVPGLRFCDLPADEAVARLDDLRAAHPVPPSLRREGGFVVSGGTVRLTVEQALEELSLLDDLSEAASSHWWALLQQQEAPPPQPLQQPRADS